MQIEDIPSKYTLKKLQVYGFTFILIILKFKRYEQILFKS